MTPKYRVRYTEYERGWGSRPDGFDDFDTLAAGQECTREFNAKNTEKTAPDWYMVAADPVFVDADVTTS
jgi:hypothetical protein